MASFKEPSSTLSRPVSHITPPLSQSNGRHHSHSVSLGAVNINHRITRRKSMSSTAANAAVAAVAAALGESPSAAPLSTSLHRRGLSSRRAIESTSVGASSGFSSYLSRNGAQDAGTGLVRKNSPNSIDENTAVEDVSPPMTEAGAVGVSSSSSGGGGGSLSGSGGKPISTKQRSRRASEGSHLVRADGKRVMNELRCDRCGKGWEHDPAWAYTSKLLISKHQQVQLLEAATVLVNMNPENPGSSDHQPRNGESDRSSSSPTASGISELRDGGSSTETTPPPTGEEGSFSAKLRDAHHQHQHQSCTPNRQHHFSTSSFSRSFQSIRSSSFTGSAPTFSPSRSHFRQSSTDTRPSTADPSGLLDDDEAGLAAAIKLCHFGTPRTGPVPMSPDIPPVPPLPARFLDSQSMGVGAGNNMAAGITNDKNNNTATSISVNTHSFDMLVKAAKQEASSPTPTVYNPITMHQTLSYRVSDVRDVKMDDALLGSRNSTGSSGIGGKKKAKSISMSMSNAEMDDDDFAQDQGSVVPMDDDDDGVFGRMEE
ncbi:uncharacterized protein PADG_01476 [Paracoccidioides brasiliensis Pb18]|uniref:C2H2-type domain-containing protein n=1 Tax=Paracoccidioides brasiliensis (strain Pb18) TaxID=502780 RepID=C1G3G0_PARBD|nr:uncharacterized protein PADG_01476 [Paracoccidioides brasiliensis Pb18]EEH45326.2 hypothetical protein PADG_01476 [Paracoccidioides brasiliensis Pb18]